MNSLTVNVHLLLASFYRPTAIRHRIVIEDNAFPSDSYAVRSHVALRGHDPETAILRLRPRPGEDTLRTEDVVATLNQHAHSIATVMIGGVNYLTGEVMDMATITAAGHDIGATVGWDLAHAAGNIPLRLHDWDVDFAAWCTYKYLNAGPGATAGAFVARASSRPPVPPAAGRLVEHRSDDPLRHEPGLAAAGLSRRLVPLKSADLRHGARAHVTGDLRQRRP